MFIKSKWGKTHIVKSGKKSTDRLPLIALHGGPGGTHIGLVNLLNLSSDRQVILFDQIGSGKSSALPKKDWKISSFVKQLEEVVKARGFKEFHLYGTSWGATLALEYYKHCKGRGIKSITLSSPLISEKTWAADAKKLIRTLPKRSREVIRLCEKIGATDSKVYSEAMSVYYKKYVFRNIPKAKKKKKKLNLGNQEIYNYFWGPSEFRATGTLRGYNGGRILKRVKCPLMITCGAFDESTPKSNKKFAKVHGKAKFVVIPKASHLCLIENRTFTLKNLNKFLAEVEAKSLFSSRGFV